MHDTSGHTLLPRPANPRPWRTKIKRILVTTLLFIAFGGGLALIFAAYQHPALLLDFGNLLSCG